MGCVALTFGFYEAEVLAPPEPLAMASSVAELAEILGVSLAAGAL